MNFNRHSDYEGKHAFLSASGYHWLRYDMEKLRKKYQMWKANERGTQLHALAAQCIKLGVTLPKTDDTLSLYVNDAILNKMVPEQVLYYSDNCFGTADTISFSDNILRIHDLKTGEHKASFDQLKIYAAIFCLEYNVSPYDILIELKIYQLNDVRECNPESDEICDIIQKIINADNEINRIKEEEL